MECNEFMDYAYLYGTIGKLYGEKHTDMKHRSATDSRM